MSLASAARIRRVVKYARMFLASNKTLLTVYNNLACSTRLGRYVGIALPLTTTTVRFLAYIKSINRLNYKVTNVDCFINNKNVGTSVTRFDDLLDFGQLFKAFGYN